MKHLAVAGLWYSTASYAAYLFINHKPEAAAMLGFIGFLLICWMMAQKDEH